MSVSCLCSMTGGVALGCKCEGLLSCFRTWTWKIIKQFVNDDNTIGPPAICGKTMQRKYQEMHLIFTPGISQPQGIYSCNSFYWSARVRQNLSQNSEVVGSFFFLTITVLVSTTFTRNITLKQDLIQHVTSRANVNQITLMNNRL